MKRSFILAMAIVAVCAARAVAADQPVLRVAVNASGVAELRPEFPWRKAGDTKYRWDRPASVDGTTTARLLWVDDSGWPAISEFPGLPFAWDGGIPTPAPTPSPVPSPEPAPPTPEPDAATKYSDLWILVFESPADRTPAQQEVCEWFDANCKRDGKTRYHRYPVAYFKSPDCPPAVKKYQPFVEAQPLPCVCVVGITKDGKSKMAHCGELPATPEKAKELWTKWGGK